MSKIIINGGIPLIGEVNVTGSKNSSLPILAATILCDEPVKLNNCPDISDVDNMLGILKHTGAKIKKDKNTVEINCATSNNHEMPREFSREIRSSIFMLGSVVSRLKKAKFTYPGGCEIGSRPIDLHLNGLRKLNISITEENGEIICQADKINGAIIPLDYPSVGATENIIMAAVLANGLTVIKNAAKEPEIIELARFLNACGAKISGAGSNVIRIKGVKKLNSIEFTCRNDRIVAGTYILLGAMCGGKIEIHNSCVDELHCLISRLKNAGSKIDILEDTVRVDSANGILSGFGLIETAPYPHFPTDLQAPVCACASIADGTSIIIENVFENRFKHLNELKKLGADITAENNIAVIHGVKSLYGAEVNATDLRAAAALALAGLSAQGTTIINNAQLLDRGYEDFVSAVRSLGGNIQKTE